MAFDSKWAHDEDRCYHGIRDDDGQRIVVEGSAFGWTDRSDRKPQRELRAPDPVVGFNWGYDGSGPHQASEAILIDALGWNPGRRIVIAFVMDWVSMAPGEFWFRRPAILRWLRGLLCDMGMHELRAPLDELPPVDPQDYAIAPEVLEELKRRRGDAVSG